MKLVFKSPLTEDYTLELSSPTLDEGLCKEPDINLTMRLEDIMAHTEQGQEIVLDGVILGYNINSHPTYNPTCLKVLILKHEDGDFCRVGVVLLQFKGTWWSSLAMVALLGPLKLERREFRVG
jgi:hypothetical protein